MLNILLLFILKMNNNKLSPFKNHPYFTYAN